MVRIRPAASEVRRVTSSTASVWPVRLNRHITRTGLVVRVGSRVSNNNGISKSRASLIFPSEWYHIREPMPVQVKLRELYVDYRALTSTFSDEKRTCLIQPHSKTPARINPLPKLDIFRSPAINMNTFQINEIHNHELNCTSTRRRFSFFSGDKKRVTVAGEYTAFANSNPRLSRQSRKHAKQELRTVGNDRETHLPFMTKVKRALGIRSLSRQKGEANRRLKRRSALL